MKLAQLKLPKGGDETFDLPYPPGFGQGKVGVSDINTVGGWISALLPYAMILGGLILLVMLLIGGFGLLVSVGNEEKVQKSAATIKNALLGFFLLFAIYWIAQIIQVLFKIQIL